MDRRHTETYRHTGKKAKAYLRLSWQSLASRELLNNCNNDGVDYDDDDEENK